MTDMHPHVPNGTNAGLLRETHDVRYATASWGKQRSAFVHADISGVQVRLAPGNKRENRKVFITDGVTEFAPSGAGLWNGFETEAAKKDRTVDDSLTALAVTLLRTGYLLDFEANLRWAEGDPVFNIVPPPELLAVIEKGLPVIKVTGKQGTIEMTPLAFIATIDAIGFAEDIKYLHKFEAASATPNPVSSSGTRKAFFESGTGRPNTVLTTANCIRHCVTNSLTSFAHRMGPGRGVAPMSVNDARTWLGITPS